MKTQNSKKFVKKKDFKAWLETLRPNQKVAGKSNVCCPLAAYCRTFGIPFQIGSTKFVYKYLEEIEMPKWAQKFVDNVDHYYKNGQRVFWPKMTAKQALECLK